ncbi:CocE/NonD family hydrolase [Marinobacter sp. 71-i]|uniref:CocE/NonD family hydrolase n=1 Tax=Marinobacter iranensis TaxID=2962607 RepID=A0ABT5YFW9_9GAMM|nr:CocE/NonD family hydrolase [Marinobacter iranensis]MDF0752574.1 CocE/NonD family hydrolase [Marinobacter iranensis]
MSKHMVSDQKIDLAYEPLNENVSFEQGVKVPMRDGVELSVNVFKPKGPGKYPVVMAVSPYGKDSFDKLDIFRNVPSMHLGKITVSDHTSFEAPDPNFWVSQGYAVIQVDTRGQGESGGETGPFHIQDSEDYYDLIEWAGAQSWSNGRVGLNGVSYLCVSQWGVAALSPPSLKAVVLWEGWNDFYRRFYKGGIPETTFMPWLWENWIKAAHNPSSGYIEPDYIQNGFSHPLNDQYWRKFDIPLEKIKVPALVCASFSDQGLHTPDTFEGFKKISSEDKWLVTHRQPKWEAYYSEESLDLQKTFFDHYLLNKGDGLKDQSRVTIKSYRDRDTFEILERNSWPPATEVYEILHLNANDSLLQVNRPAIAGSAKYDSTSEEGLYFDYRISEEMIIGGESKLSLSLSIDDADDTDLFIGIEKLDSNGDRVLFYGFGGVNPNDIVTRGWLRVSHREIDETASAPLRPVHKHQRLMPVNANEVVAVEIELLPHSTTFLPGETLRIRVQGKPIQPDAPLLGFEDSVNKGKVSVHTGGEHLSCISFSRLDK